MVSFIAKVGF